MLEKISFGAFLKVSHFMSIEVRDKKGKCICWIYWDDDGDKADSFPPYFEFEGYSFQNLYKYTVNYFTWDSDQEMLSVCLDYEMDQKGGE